MPNKLNSVFCLGDWRVEPQLNRLSMAGATVQLEPKSMEVLVYLCQRPGEVVSADEIIEAVWHGRPMGDNPVYKSVAKLRRALGDDAARPSYIATVAKKGYRLVADVEPATAASLRSSGRRRPASLARTFLPVAAAMLFGVALAAAIFWRPLEEPLELRFLSSFSGSHSEPSFAPDGESIAFVSDADGIPHIWTLGFEDQAPRQLTEGARPDTRPRWSPGGDSILFMRGGSVWSVPAAGGEAIEILRNAYNPNWSRDGSRIVFERRFEVWTANADGGQQTRVSGVPRRELPLAPRWPAFSPGGNEIVYLDADTTPFADLWRVALDGGTPERLTVSPALASAPVWAPDGQHIIYSSQRGGSRTLWQVNVDDGTARPLLTGSGDDDFPDVSADGTKLIYSNRRERFAVVRSDAESGQNDTLHESRQLIIAPELSPDRTQIAFMALARGGGVQLYTMPLSGGTPMQVTRDSLATHAIPRWAADAQHLYFYYTRNGLAFAKVNTAGGEPEVVVPGWDWSVSNGASVSPDETRAVYSRLTGQVPVQTMLRDLESSEDRAFYATLEYPRWSRDGENIIGALHVDQRFPGDIAVCPIEGPNCQIIAPDARIPMFSADESQIYYVRGFGREQELFVSSVDGTGAESKVLTMAPLFPLGPFYDVTPNGEIVWVRYEQEPSELWLTDL
ncbi:MAG: winged helix-turn-helix domain-containing protein [Woeseiaceae bacterium]|nr:winged helix-turn-helix domain-containing protein [Woeseiaceae bacterium]